jgi:hypothetical protein
MHITGSTTHSFLYFAQNPSTILMIHADGSDRKNLSDVMIRVQPNIGASLIYYTDANGDVSFNFSSIVNSVIINATDANNSYLPYNTIANNLAGGNVNINILMQLRSASYFNFHACILDNNGDLVPDAMNEIGCTKDNHFVSFANVSSGASGCFDKNNLELALQCALYTRPPLNYQSTGWRYFKPAAPDYYMPNQTALTLMGNTTAPGNYYLKGVIVDANGNPILGDYIIDYIVNTTYLDFVPASNGGFEINNLIENSNIKLIFEWPGYKHKNFSFTMGQSYNYTFKMEYTGIGTTIISSATSSAATTTTIYSPTTTLIDSPNANYIYCRVFDKDYDAQTAANATFKIFHNGGLILQKSADSSGHISAYLNPGVYQINAENSNGESNTYAFTISAVSTFDANSNYCSLIIDKRIGGAWNWVWDGIKLIVGFGGLFLLMIMFIVIGVFFLLFEFMMNSAAGKKRK